MQTRIAQCERGGDAHDSARQVSKSSGGEGTKRARADASVDGGVAVICATFVCECERTRE